MSEIKKCPFCGSSAAIMQTTTSINHDGIIENTYKVQCVSCRAETRTCASIIYQNCIGEVFVKANGAEDAIKLWNMREGEQK